jgi:DNA polymerase V
MNMIIAHVDCASFYCSVERVFHAGLQKRPVIVLSNGDGCVVAASEEAKALGVVRGTPLFRIKQLVEEHDIALYSSNYVLYQDVSDRIMALLATFARERCREVYSIDEGFIDVSHVPPGQLMDYGKAIIAHILRLTGIPVRVGFGRSKTQAKLATHLVKRDPGGPGVVDLVSIPQEALDALLATVSVEDIWNVGPKTSAKLQIRKIISAKDLRDADPKWIRRFLHVVGERIVYELRGVVCLPLELDPKPKKGVMVARSFGRNVETAEELSEALCHYLALATAKLRRQASAARFISIYIHTNPFDESAPQYANSASSTLLFHSDFPPDFFPIVKQLLVGIYRGGYHYKRAGVFLSDIRPVTVTQGDLFGSFSREGYERKRRLMQALDRLNEQLGRDSIVFLAQGIARDWQAKQQYLSKRYTTRWNELLSVR